MKSIKNVVLVTIAIMFLLTIKTLAFNPAGGTIRPDIGTGSEKRTAKVYAEYIPR